MFLVLLRCSSIVHQGFDLVSGFDWMTKADAGWIVVLYTTSLQSRGVCRITPRDRVSGAEYFNSR